MARNKRSAFSHLSAITAVTGLLLSGTLLSAMPAQAAETPAPATAVYLEIRLCRFFFMLIDI